MKLQRSQKDVRILVTIYIKNSYFRSRSDFGTKTSEKIGKGIKSLKQGVMAKSLEGMVDPLDPAYDLTDLCVSILPLSKWYLISK